MEKGLVWNLEEAEEVFESVGIKFDKKYLKRYYLFIDYLRNNDTTIGAIVVEKHHIWSVSMFPEHDKNSDNIIRISGRAHYIAHWILAKTFGGGMWFAFNQMRRIITSGQGKPSVLYEYARKYVSEQISLANTGRKNTIAQRKLSSKIHKGMVNARDKNGNVHRVKTTDPRFETGELVNALVGNKHSDETKQKMSENGIKGKLAYEKNGKVRYFREGEKIPKGYQKFFKEWPEGYLTDVVWYHDPATNEELRLRPDDKIPDGYIIGRKPTASGWDIINSKITVLDLKLKKYFMVDYLESWQTTRPGTALIKVKIYIFGRYVFTSLKQFWFYCQQNNIFYPSEVNVKKYINGKFPKTHNSMTEANKKFLEQHQGKSYTDLGLQVIPLQDFEWKDEYVIWRKD